MTPPTIDELTVADRAQAWRALGFETAGDDVLEVGSVRIRLEQDAGRGIAGWSLRGTATTELDGLPTVVSERETGPPAPVHPNGVAALDHVVAFTPDLERTLRALEAAGLELRRRREGPTPGGARRQAFFRLAEVILEVIEHPPDAPAAADRSAPARFWGLAFSVQDLDGLVERLGVRVGTIRAAVQPGRRIAPLRRSGGLSVPVAFITPSGEAAGDRP